jgi:MoxR-like ATPase/uncharacterized protein YlxP (DUF503 family)
MFRIAGLILILTLTSNSFAADPQCAALLGSKQASSTSTMPAADRQGAVPVVQTNRREAIVSGSRVNAFFEAVGIQILERGNVLNSLLISMIAKEHLLMVGPPGNAKTTLTKLVFENIKERSTGKESFFATQMTAETSLSDTHGGINYKVLQDTGRQERLYEEGILGSRLAMLDEQFDMRPNGYRNILDVLAERAHAQSGKKFKGKTWTVVGASNTFIPEVYAKFDGSDQPRALIDRYAFVVFIPAEMEMASSNRAIIKGAQRARQPLPEVFFEDFEAIQKLVPEVVIPDYVSDILSLVQYRLRTIFEAKEEDSLQEYKEKIQAGEKPLPPYKSTKYMSGRTLGKAAGVLRATVALDFASRKGQRALTVTTKDLNDLEKFYSLGGPEEAFIQNQISRASKEVEKEQYKNILWERKVVRETLSSVLKDFNAKVTQMGTQDIYSKAKNYSHLSASERRELIDTLRALYLRKLEIDALAQEKITPDLIAEVSVGELAQALLKSIEPANADKILNSWTNNAPITKNRHIEGRYSQPKASPSGSFSLLGAVTEKLKQVAHDVFRQKDESATKAEPATKHEQVVQEEAALEAEQTTENHNHVKPTLNEAKKDSDPVVERNDAVDLAKNSRPVQSERVLKVDASNVFSILIKKQEMGQNMDDYRHHTEEFLKEGADPNLFLPMRGHDGRYSLLAHTIYWRQPLTLKLLLEYGADLDKPYVMGMWPPRPAISSLEKYSMERCTECHRVIKEHRARLKAVNQNQNIATQPKVYNPAVLEEFKAKFYAKFSEIRKDELLEFLQRGMDPNGIVFVDQDSQRWTLVGILSYYDLHESIEIALEHGANPLIVNTYNNITGSSLDFAPTDSTSKKILENHIRNHPELR